MSKKGVINYNRKNKRKEERYLKGRISNSDCFVKSSQIVRQNDSSISSFSLYKKDDSSFSDNRQFSCYCDEWLKLNRNRVKESTYAKYNGILEKHIRPRLGNFNVQQLTLIELEEFGNELLCKEMLSPKTVKDILTVLNSIIKYTNKQVPEDLSDLEIIYPKVPRKDMRILTKEEQTRLIRYLCNDIDECKFGVLLSLLTGMRIGEVCALKWENICLQNQTLTVKSTMQRLKDYGESTEFKTKIVISDPKTYSSVRVIPLTNFAVQLCKMYWCDTPNAFVLTGDLSRFVEPRTLQYKLKQYTSDCGIFGVHFHTLRHTFATRCAEVGFEIKSLSEILGHSSVNITLERYVHSSMELKRDNMNKLSAIGF